MLCAVTAAAVAAVSMLCFAGCSQKPTDERTVSGIITVVDGEKYTLQPGTIESSANPIPNGEPPADSRTGEMPSDVGMPNDTAAPSDTAAPRDDSVRENGAKADGSSSERSSERNDGSGQNDRNTSENAPGETPPDGNKPGENPPDGKPNERPFDGNKPGTNPNGGVTFTENGEAAIEFTIADGAYIASGTEFVSAEKLAVGSIVTVRLNEKNEAQAIIICSAAAQTDDKPRNSAMPSDSDMPNDPNGQRNTADPSGAPTETAAPNATEAPSDEPQATEKASVSEKN